MEFYFNYFEIVGLNQSIIFNIAKAKIFNL